MDKAGRVVPIRRIREFGTSDRRRCTPAAVIAGTNEVMALPKVLQCIGRVLLICGMLALFATRTTPFSWFPWEALLLAGKRLGARLTSAEKTNAA